MHAHSEMLSDIIPVTSSLDDDLPDNLDDLAQQVEADARAFLLLRPYVKTAVRVDLEDPADPTPYWLLSSRRPEALAAALAGATGRLTARRLRED